MPGRVPMTVPRASAISTKTRSSTATRNNFAVAIPDEGEDTSLRALICSVFGEVQKSVNGHRKLIVSLRRIQEACCYEPANTNRRALEQDYDETEFNHEFCRCMSRILPIKKSEPVGDRIVKFLGAFLKHSLAIDNSVFLDGEVENDQAIPETPTSRLTTQVISFLIPLLVAKDKVVRFRSTQIISHLINTLDTIDDELFQHVRLGLLKRLRDKESNIRVQAVCGLGRLAGETNMEEQENNESDDDDSSGGALERLLDSLQNDPSADVRRSLLLNLPFTPTTLPFLLERARDLDASIRLALYAKLLPALGDFRHLSLTHREKLLRWGLRDRDDNVKKAMARLFRERWIEDCVRPHDIDGRLEATRGQALSAPDFQGLLELLERIDVVNAGTDGGIALDAMREFWQGRPDYCNFVTFEETYWRDLSPESVFIARTFNDFSQSSLSSEDKMPELTRFAFLLQTNINDLVGKVRKSALQPDFAEDSIHQEFIVEQLLYIALTLDYSDEVGRRTVFSLMRQALALAELPEEATKLVVEVLHTACGNSAAREKEFSDVVLEAIAEVHDTIMGEEHQAQAEEDLDGSFHSARSELSSDSPPRDDYVDDDLDKEKAFREIMVNMKCLHIAQCMLENVECSLERNPALVTMLNNLVVPAVRSQDAPIRERGLICLGLCCLLDKNLSEENLELFLLCFSKGHESLQSTAIQIIADILTAHPTLLSPTAAKPEAHEHPLHKPIHKLFSKSLKSPSALVQFTSCTALAKLMLSVPISAGEGDNSILNHDELLKMLTIAYFDPDLATNSGLRQSLSYFLPVYCHSRKENLLRMGRIALSVLQWYLNTKEEMDVEAEEDVNGGMVGVGIVTAHLVDWTDERKLAPGMTAQDSNLDHDDTECEVHLKMAGDVLEKVLGVCSKDERRIYISVLGKLHISPMHDPKRLQWVVDLLQAAIEGDFAEDASSRNTFKKMHAAILKFQPDPGQTRGGSRAISIVPHPASISDDGSETISGADDNNISEAALIATEPALPRGSELNDIRFDEIDLSEHLSILTLERGEQGGEYTHLPHTAARRASRPRWKPEELQGKLSVGKEDTNVARALDHPILSESQRNTIPNEPTGTPIGLPPKANNATLSAAEQKHPRPAQRTVRASRRQQLFKGEDDE